MSVRALGYAGFGVKDVAAWRTFAEDVLGVAANLDAVGTIGLESPVGVLLLRFAATTAAGKDRAIDGAIASITHIDGMGVGIVHLLEMVQVTAQQAQRVSGAQRGQRLLVDEAAEVQIR